MYVGGVRRDFGFLLLGWLIYSLLVVFLILIIGVNIDQFFDPYYNQYAAPGINDDLIPQNSMDPESFYSPIPVSFLFIFGTVYLVYWIFQAVDAYRLAKNLRHLDKEGNLLWC